MPWYLIYFLLFAVEPAGCQIPDDIKFKVYARERKPGEISKGATPIERREYLLFSNDHPVYEFTAREDPATKWTRLYVGYENTKTGRKDVVQTRKLIVRAIPKGQRAVEAAMAKRGSQEVGSPHFSPHICFWGFYFSSLRD